MTLKTGTLVRCPSRRAMQATWRDLIKEGAIGVVLDYPDNPNDDNEYNEYTYVRWSDWGSAVHMTNALIHYDYELEPLPIQNSDRVVCPSGTGFGVYNYNIVDEVGTVVNAIRIGDSVQYDVEWPSQRRFSHLEHELVKYEEPVKQPEDYRSQRQQEQQDGYRREVEAAAKGRAFADALALDSTPTFDRHMGATEEFDAIDDFDFDDEGEYCYQCKGVCRFELGDELVDDSDDYELDDQLYSGPVNEAQFVEHLLQDEQPETGGFIVVSVTVTRYIPLN